MVPSADRLCAVRAGSSKYSNGLAILNHSSPGSPLGEGFIASSSTCNSPASTRPTVPRCASHSAVSQAVNPMASVAP